MPEEVGLPPLEIPWKLAATTQPLVAGEPDETTISLFFFEPDEEEVEGEPPDERIVYLKYTVSVSPAAFPPGTPPVAGGVLGAGVPCFHLQLDLKVRKSTGEFGTIRPYFHAAAPLHRRTLQTGVVGLDAFEGESDAQFMGKSRSQMYELSKTHSSTTSASLSAGVGFPIGPVSVGVSGSLRATSTDISGRRAGTQSIDTTTREASQERREMVSHHTKVENVLTLLNTKYVGTPHLRFSLSPQPQTLLSVDPSDPNLWFSQLLARRSSGVEGHQEFTAVVIVPRGEDFCVNARLQRVCVLDAPPGPLTFDERFVFQQHLGRLMNYLDRAYPLGTALEEFDVDLVGALPTPNDFTRPVVEGFVITPGTLLILADVVSPTPLPFPGSVKRATINFKHMLELWLETLRDEYEREAARSPLERGVLLGEERFLDTCFAFSTSGLSVSGSNASVGPLQLFEVDVRDFDVGGVTATASSARKTARERAYEAVTRGNLLENRLAILLGNRQRPKTKPFTLDAEAMVGLLVEAWAKLAPGDSQNLPFDAAVEALHLDDSHQRLLKATGARDLRGIAEAIRTAPVISRYNERTRERRRIQKDGKRQSSVPKPIRWPVSADAAAAMRRAIGSGLEQDRTR